MEATGSSDGLRIGVSELATDGPLTPAAKGAPNRQNVTGQTEENETTETSQGRKKPAKKKKKAGPVLVDMPAQPEESADEAKHWADELRAGRATQPIPQFGILGPSYKSHLPTFLTPSCSSLSLSTPRLILRQVEVADLSAIKRIKTEPVVQRTQLYGSPHELVIRDAFLERYIRSSIPRASTEGAPSRCRELYVFAITLNEPEGVELASGAKLKSGNRIKNAEGYIGNIALSLTCSPTSNLLPKPRKVFTQPSFDQSASAELTGTMFFEIHPQLWGKGIMGEAFAAVVRFAMEDVGSLEIKCDPLKGNEACIKLCERHRFKYVNTSTDNPYRKPQVWHKLTRREWWEKNRPGEAMKGTYDGKILCRWDMFPHTGVQGVTGEYTARESVSGRTGYLRVDIKRNAARRADNVGRIGWRAVIKRNPPEMDNNVDN